MRGAPVARRGPREPVRPPRRGLRGRAQRWSVAPSPARRPRRSAATRTAQGCQQVHLECVDVLVLIDTHVVELAGKNTTQAHVASRGAPAQQQVNAVEHPQRPITGDVAATARGHVLYAVRRPGRDLIAHFGQRTQGVDRTRVQIQQRRRSPPCAVPRSAGPKQGTCVRCNSRITDLVGTGNCWWRGLREGPGDPSRWASDGEAHPDVGERRPETPVGRGGHIGRVRWLAGLLVAFDERVQFVGCTHTAVLACECGRTAVCVRNVRLDVVRIPRRWRHPGEVGASGSAGNRSGIAAGARKCRRRR